MGCRKRLPEWIRYNGLRRIKIKLAGNDLAWDLARVVAIDRATTETQRERGVAEWFYSLDFNEQCPNVGYLLEFLRRLKERTAAGFERIQYVEQPTARDLKADRANVMHAAAKLRPVVIDESLTDIESLMLAREMGYSGAALKACKGQSQVLLMAAAGAEAQDVPVRAGSDVSGRVADPFGGPGGAHSGSGGHRGQRARVRAGGEQTVGGQVPRHLQSTRRHDGHIRAGRAGTGRGLTCAMKPAATNPAAVRH